MIVTVNSQHLAAELRLLAKIVPNKPAIAILSHALLTADDGIHFFATDLEIGFSCACEASVIQPGKIALPVARFLSLVEQFPNDDVQIAVDGTKVNVTCGAFRSKLQAMPVDDFPQPLPVDGTANTLDGDAFRRLITRTRYAINATSQKYVLQGALLTLAGPAAAMVATDGKRLALATASRAGSDVSLVIPAKALDVLAGSDDDVEVTVGSKQLLFAYGGRMLTSRMLEGKFPAYERIIPRDNDKIVTVGRVELMAALKRIVLVSEDNRATYILIEPGKLTLAARSAEVGQADEAVRAEYDGASLKVCVNGSYVLDFLEAASGSAVTLQLKDANTAMLMLDGDDHVGVVMLMKG